MGNLASLELACYFNQAYFDDIHRCEPRRGLQCERKIIQR